MCFIPVVLVAACAAVANAHFQLQYPLPRGPFVQDSEPTFCDGYANAVSNRTVFPLDNGVIDLNSEHPQWVAGVIISTKEDPTSFSDFNSSSGYQLVVPYFQTSGEGKFCFPINISASGVSGVHDGANVTIQVVFNGGDDTLYQCADLTLSANATVPSNATIPSNATSGCANVTANTVVSLPTTTARTASNAAGKNVVTIFSVIAAVLTGSVLFL